MKILGLSPSYGFSGFETSFFDSIKPYNAKVENVHIDSSILKYATIFTSFNINKKKWGTKRDFQYFTSIVAYNTKSRIAQQIVRNRESEFDAIYQIGSLWNPTNAHTKLPFVLHVDYTSLLSKKRNSEWRRKPGRHQEFWVEQEIIMYNAAAVILTTTENARQSIINDYNISPAKIVTVGAGVSPPYDQIDVDRKPEYNSQKILFVGKGFAGKGLDTLLEAFKKVKQALPGAELTIVGPTNLTIEQEGVNYLGRIADKYKVKQLYYEHSLFVMPSRFEPLGQVFLEAMSCGLPCIGGNVDAMPEIIDQGVTGYNIELGDNLKLSEYMTEILTNRQLAENMGQAGLQKLKDNYTWVVVGKRIYDNIRGVI